MKIRLFCNLAGRMPRPRLCRLIFRRLNATSRFKKSYFCPESDEAIHRGRFNNAHVNSADNRIAPAAVDCAIFSAHRIGFHSISIECLIKVSYATKRDATLGDVNVTITVGGLVICSVHIDPLIDANPIADKCRQMRRWYMTWRCDRFSTQWEQTETETQPTAKIPK
ncbi:hypothetical protein T01_5811 [Trichinella spiralis]|uniref:Uncharacterized protein n=1 Tax=Trichinella spiralis TaxID=6334 RepID=A0A0V1AXE3_TRISP|nr:hypothetical protein T01_5811 [Trichinella spiralis]